MRRQVNPRSGSVEVEGDAVVVTAEDGETILLKRYRLEGENENRFVYSIDLSQDGGRSWETGSIEMMLTRVE